MSDDDNENYKPCALPGCKISTTKGWVFRNCEDDFSLMKPDEEMHIECYMRAIVRDEMKEKEK